MMGGCRDGGSSTPTRNCRGSSTRTRTPRPSGSRGSWRSTTRWRVRWAWIPASADSPEAAAVFAGNALPDGARPIAQAYAGHQFGHFTALGDGRAILLGEQITPSGERFGHPAERAWPDPLLAPRRRARGARPDAARVHHQRSDARARHSDHAQPRRRRDRRTRVPGDRARRRRAHARRRQPRSRRHHAVGGGAPGPRGAARPVGLHARASLSRNSPDAAEPHLALLDAIVDRQARLIARWQLVGFIHGVMNTDNMALSGETIDYGPCAFMDAYDPATVFSSIDHAGRYAYGNQPPIAHWNLTRLAEAMLPLFDADTDRAIERATDSLDRFQDLFEAYWLDGMRSKLGLFTQRARRQGAG